MSDVQVDPVAQYQKYMSYFVAAHVPAYAIAALVFGLPLVAPVLLQILMAGFLFLGGFLYNRNRAIALDLSAMGLVLTPAVAVYLLSGHVWQLDAHMYFFAALAMVIAFKSIRATLIATTAIALHHLVLNFALPFAVFPEGADFFRVVFHAFIVIIETAVIIFTIVGLQKSDEAIMAESAAAREALSEANEAKQKQEEAEMRSKEERKAAMKDMAKGFDTKVGGLISSLANASSELQGTAEAMRMVADKTSNDSITVSNSSGEASQNVGTVASAMEEMSASSTEIASQAHTVKNKSADMTNNAQYASENVGNLNVLAENIGGVVVAIRDIAEQTNLLALNATIEAARAGAAGKGFAVVAEEVKKLASETAEKTDEIEQRIAEIQNATRASVDSVERILGDIGEIDHSVTSVTAAIEEQNSTISEIVRSVSEASAGVQRVSETIMDVQKGAEETGLSSDSVYNAAKQAAELSDGLQKSVDQFLRDIQSDDDATALAAE